MMTEVMFGSLLGEDQQSVINNAVRLLEGWSKLLPFYNGAELRNKYFGGSNCVEIYNNLVHMMKFFRSDITVLSFMHSSKSSNQNFSGNTAAFVLRTNNPPKKVEFADIIFVQVYVCDSFFYYDDEYFNAYRAGVLFHELSHLLLGTADLAYGRDNCARLARENPESAARNADNYGFYCEEGIAKEFNIAKPVFDI